MAVLNNIYPPLVSTYANPFIINPDSEDENLNKCIIRFALSDFNNIKEIKNAQVTVSYQTTNQSALDPIQYPSGIMIKEVKEYGALSGSLKNRYYVIVDSNDLEYGFELNTYYKIQIRFTNQEAEDLNIMADTQTIEVTDTSSDYDIINYIDSAIETEEGTQNVVKQQQRIDSWLTTNLDCFSEWSTVVLARGISQPTLEVENFDYDEDLNVWMAEDVYILGKLTFQDEKETDMLKQFRIKVYEVNNSDGVYRVEDLNETDRSLITDSGDQYVNEYTSKNEINYTIEYLFKDGKEYTLSIEYTTQNLFTQTVEFIFIYFDTAYEKLYAEVLATPDNENGRMAVRVAGRLPTWSSSNIVFRRTSSESNFTQWEDIHNITIEDVINEELDYTWYDRTIESGVWYMYGAQKRDSNGNRGILVTIDEPVMMEYEYAFLTRADRQLKIKFNPNISSFARTVSESKMDALGSKYPIIRRNGYIDYKTFPISGTISFLTDEDHLFTSRSEVYGDQADDYVMWHTQRKINDYQDTLYEREFREVVSDFLYDNNVKLFRSPTEGNIMVKLMNISFTPNQILGRHIYDFSCTAYEVADCNIKNYNKYGIQYVGDYSQNLVFRNRYTGQIKQIIPANTNVLDILTTLYDNNLRNNWSIAAKYLDYVKIIMHEPPYWIEEKIIGNPERVGSSSLEGEEIANNRGLLKSDYISTEKARKNGYLLGYIVKIINKDDERVIVIPYDGIYELMGEMVEIISITFPYDTNVEINYHINLAQEEDLRQLLKQVVYEKRAGQLWGSFDYEEDIYLQIWRKYYDLNLKLGTKQMMVSLNFIHIEADAGTVVYIKRSNESDLERFIIGETNVLEIYNEDAIIEEIYFKGVYLDEINDRDNYWVDAYTNVNMEETLNLLKQMGIKSDENNITIEDITLENLKQLSSDKSTGKIRAIHNGVYTIQEDEVTKQYIFYKGEWYSFVDSHYVICPVDGLIDYYCEILNGKLGAETSEAGDSSEV